MAGARKGKGEGKIGRARRKGKVEGKIGRARNTRAPLTASRARALDFFSPFPFLAPATQATLDSESIVIGRRDSFGLRFRH